MLFSKDMLRARSRVAANIQAAQQCIATQNETNNEYQCCELPFQLHNGLFSACIDTDDRGSFDRPKFETAVTSLSRGAGKSCALGERDIVLTTHAAQACFWRAGSG